MQIEVNHIIYQLQKKSSAQYPAHSGEENLSEMHTYLLLA